MERISNARSPDSWRSDRMIDAMYTYIFFSLRTLEIHRCMLSSSDQRLSQFFPVVQSPNFLLRVRYRRETVINMSMFALGSETRFRGSGCGSGEAISMVGRETDWITEGDIEKDSEAHVVQSPH